MYHAILLQMNYSHITYCNFFFNLTVSTIDLKKLDSFLYLFSIKPSIFLCKSMAFYFPHSRHISQTDYVVYIEFNANVFVLIVWQTSIKINTVMQWSNRHFTGVIDGLI